MARDGKQSETLDLAKATEQLLQECRMVLPGIQALFGFQLVAVFNTRFAEALTEGEQALHLAALVLVAVSAGLVMAPAAYHRQTTPREVTASFLRLATGLLTAALLPLAVGICLDVYLIARIVLGRADVSLVLALGLLAVLVGLWFVLPLWRDRDGGRRP